MTLLGQIQKGKRRAPPRILLYGVEGIGKSTFGAQTPKPIFIQCEDGLDEIECEKFPLATTYDDVMTVLAEICVPSSTTTRRPLSTRPTGSNA